ncbi:DUF7134 domain-containing protein [Blastococcus atacamensis]|uniref:DUF7134 domain-containing protein n=1 Tax=Blastococcus atacamensis TaxID=2070508 RepID=UPI000CEC1D96|nr:hypothetical protein [Blastococcus atacamensis]
MARPLERLTEWTRERPFVVDAALAAAVCLLTVFLPATGYTPYEDAALAVGLLLTAPLAWRRTAPVPAAAVVIGASLLELVVVPEFLPANVAALITVYSLAAYAPRWAGRGGLAVGLLGAVLAALRYYAPVASDGLIPATLSIGVAVVAAWALSCCWS